MPLERDFRLLRPLHHRLHTDLSSPSPFLCRALIVLTLHIYTLPYNIGPLLERSVRFSHQRLAQGSIFGSNNWPPGLFFPPVQIFCDSCKLKGGVVCVNTPPPPPPHTHISARNHAPIKGSRAVHKSHWSIL